MLKDAGKHKFYSSTNSFYSKDNFFSIYTHTVITEDLPVLFKTFFMEMYFPIKCFHTESYSVRCFKK